jgi:hypothetical protein
VHPPVLGAAAGERGRVLGDGRQFAQVVRVAQGVDRASVGLVGLPAVVDRDPGEVRQDTPWTDPRLDEEAQRWILLAQIDTDADANMMWGDCGTLYWLIRPEDLAARRFEEAKLTWQCC